MTDRRRKHNAPHAAVRGARKRLRLLACLSTAAAALVLVGCGDDSLAPVSGVVLLDGEPLPRGTVRFTPSSGRGASGEIRSDGTFTLGTYGESDGALIGWHKVAVIAYEPAQGGGDGRPDMTQSSPEINYLAPKRYMSPESSGLRYEVTPGRNHAELKLTR